jgi:hypothetical protein
MIVQSTNDYPFRPRLFAAEGAAVVVNDLGSAPDRTGSQAGPATLIAEEVVGRGGVNEDRHRGPHRLALQTTR